MNIAGTASFLGPARVTINTGPGTRGPGTQGPEDQGPNDLALLHLAFMTECNLCQYSKLKCTAVSLLVTESALLYT